jgi:hypothetical protein
MSAQTTVASPRSNALVWTRDFKLYITSRAISLVGSALTMVALPVIAYRLTHSAYWTALVSVTEALPYLLVSVVAGVAADRRSRLRIMIAAEASCGLLLLTIPVADMLGALTAAQIVLTALLSRSMFVFFDAANFGALIRLVTDRGLPRANSIIYGGGAVVDVTGPIAAGALLALQSPVLLVTYDAMTFLISAGLLLGVNRHGESQDRAVANLSFTTLVKDGMNFLWNKRTVRNMTFINALLCFSAGGYYAEVVVWADRSLRISRGDVRLGVLYGAFGVGAVAGSMASSALRAWLDVPTGRAALFLIAGIFGVGTFLSRNWITAACGISVWAFCYMAIMINTITVRQLSTPPELQGRVNIVGRSISLGIGWPLGAMSAGLIATYSGARASLIWCMLPLCVVGIYGLRHVRKWRPVAG